MVLLNVPRVITAVSSLKKRFYPKTLYMFLKTAVLSGTVMTFRVINSKIIVFFAQIITLVVAQYSVAIVPLAIITHLIKTVHSEAIVQLALIAQLTISLWIMSFFYRLINI